MRSPTFKIAAPKPRGFAAMDPERRSKIAQQGGLKAAELARLGLGGGHRFTSETGAAAARKKHVGK